MLRGLFNTAPGSYCSILGFRDGVEAVRYEGYRKKLLVGLL